MSIRTRILCSSIRYGLLSASLFVVTNLGSSAQTAPSLIPTTVKVVAGGAASNPASGGICPVSGYIANDAYGDGCLATEVLLGTGTTTPGPRDAIADASGNVFFGDYANGIVHRIDAVTGIMTAVAGGPGSSPAANSVCGPYTSTDAKGDGCLGSAVHLSHPTGLTFDPAGNLYIADAGYGQVRKVTAQNGSVAAVNITSGGSGYTTAPTVTFSAPPTGGILATGTAVLSGTSVVSVTITTPGSGYTTPPTVTFSAPPTGGTLATGTTAPTGVISLVAGSVSGTLGYNASNASTTVTAATSVLYNPYSIAFDNQGDLFIADEFTAAVLVLNTNTSGTNTVNNVAIPAGTFWKIAGTLTSNGPYCANGSGTNSGCTYNHVYTDGIQATSDYLRNAYAVAVDNAGNTYITEEYYDTIVKVNSLGVLNTFVGANNSNGSATARGVAPAIKIGSPFGLAIDSTNNLYFTDAADGTVWRVDATSGDQYLIGSGFGKSGTGFASTTLPGPGIYGISVDANEDLFFGDTEKNTVSEIASGTQFGAIGANQPTQNVEIHFVSGDGPATSAPYTLTAGANNFTLGTPTLVANNTDGTSDYLLPITATPSVLGLFTGTLKVTSLHSSASFYLSGTYVQSPVTRTSLSYTAGVTCSGTTTYSTTTPITLTATIAANGPNPPTAAADTVTFYANNGTTNTAIGSPVQVKQVGSTYTATLTTAFATPGTYTLTAVFSGDTYFHTSTGTAPSTITSSTPAYTLTPVSNMQSSIVAGQTALYSFNVGLNVYAGTVSFAVTGLPAYATYTLSPTTITGTGCSTPTGTPYTVSLNVYTQQKTVQVGGFGATGRGPWQLLSVVVGLGLALFIGLRRRRVPMPYGQLWMLLALLIASSGALACGKAAGTVLTPPTPSGSYTITVTPTGTAGTAPAPITFPLTVN